MADTIVSVRPINSATFAIKHKVTAGDQVARGIVFDFQTAHDLVASVTVTAPATNAVVVANLGVSYPDVGKVRVGGTGLVENQVISLMAGLNCLEPELKV